MIHVCFTTESNTWTGVCSGSFVTQSGETIRSATECADDKEYCGFGPALWSILTNRLGLREGVDWNRICAGGSAFYATLQDMAERNGTDAVCDMTASGITATPERAIGMGLQLTRPIMRSPSVAMINAPIDTGSRWEFMRPLSIQLWVAMSTVVILIPVVVVAFELVFSTRSRYLSHLRTTRRNGTVTKGGHRRIWAAVLRAYGEGLWECTGHFLQTHYMHVRSLPARMVIIAYAFSVIVFCNTYIANLSAWLTRGRLGPEVQSMSDLWMRRIGTYGIYQRSLYETAGLRTVGITDIGAGWMQNVLRALRRHELFGVIFDSSTIVYMSSLDSDCSLRTLPDRLFLVNKVFAFKRTFSNTSLVDAVDHALLGAMEDGTLDWLSQQFSTAQRPCVDMAMEEVVEPAKLYPLSGLWFILGACALFALCWSMYTVLQCRRHPDANWSQKIDGRVRELANVMSRTTNSLSFSTPSRHRAAGSNATAGLALESEEAERRLRWRMQQYESTLGRLQSEVASMHPLSISNVTSRRTQFSDDH